MNLKPLALSLTLAFSALAGTSAATAQTAPATTTDLPAACESIETRTDFQECMYEMEMGINTALSRIPPAVMTRLQTDPAYEEEIEQRIENAMDAPACFLMRSMQTDLHYGSYDSDEAFREALAIYFNRASNCMSGLAEGYDFHDEMTPIVETIRTTGLQLKTLSERMTP